MPSCRKRAQDRAGPSAWPQGLRAKLALWRDPPSSGRRWAAGDPAHRPGVMGGGGLALWLCLPGGPPLPDPPSIQPHAGAPEGHQRIRPEPSASVLPQPGRPRPNDSAAPLKTNRDASTSSAPGGWWQAAGWEGPSRGETRSSRPPWKDSQTASGDSGLAQVVWQGPRVLRRELMGHLRPHRQATWAVPGRLLPRVAATLPDSRVLQCFFPGSASVAPAHPGHP